MSVSAFTLISSGIRAGDIPGQPQPDIPDQPGKPVPPQEPGEPTLPDQPPPAPVAQCRPREVFERCAPPAERIAGEWH
ncbi:hypothetical protein [Ectopseudomonas guguanensis]|uniref:hypothetical protein n=1 Tax=Ectopseudomonas guguanensis TaxID=1198456 RepID=UPI0003FB7255|nr:MULTISPECIES: hypothetical protein [Pseudomonas]MPT18033.1 hypothetical protein [Pseudomonas sp.]WJH56068.1 hypothetical protein FE254_07765 [Pseudomonas guguanensis]